MIRDHSLISLHQRAAAARADARAMLVEEVAIAATDFRRKMASYLADQAILASKGVALDDLVSRTWDRFEAVAVAEERLFAAVDALNAEDGLVRVALQD